MRLGMSDGDHVLSIALDIIGFDVFACSLVEKILQVKVLLCD